MKKRIDRKLSLTVAFVLAAAGNPAFAAANEAEISALKQHVEELTQQNQLLNRRLTEMEQTLQKQPENEPTVAGAGRLGNPGETATAKEDAGTAGEDEQNRLSDIFSLSGSIEGDLIAREDFQGKSTSEFNLDTVELILEAKATNWATGRIVVDYDGGDEDLYLDEATVTIGKTDSLPLFLTAGKMYAPFGDFSTNMIQDPFTQTLGEINEEGVIFGWEHNGLTAALFACNGVEKTGEDQAINGFGAALTYTYEQDDLQISFGAGWASNLADADGVQDFLPRSETDDILLAGLVPGLNLHAEASLNGFSVLTEYTAALDSFHSDELAFAGDGAGPKAWNTELAYATELSTKETVFALGVQKTWEALALELPEYRYSASAAMAFYKGLSLHLEYYLDEDYASADGGTGSDGHGFTTRLAYEF